MVILPSFLVAAMLIDFLPVHGSAMPTSLTSDNPAGMGELTVQVESAAGSASAPRGATRLPLAVLNLSASCDADIVLEGIDIKHEGLGNSSDIVSVYLGNTLRRLSRSKRFDVSSSIASLSIRSFTVKRCDAVRLAVYGDLSADADPAGEHGVTIADPADIHSSAGRTVLSFSDDTMSVVTAPMNAGKITVNFLPTHGVLRYGRDETLARIQLSADAQSSHLLRRITLTNRENARDMDFTSLRMETRTGERLTYPVMKMDGRELTLTFSPPFVLPRSSTVVLLIKGEVRASWSRKLSFYLEEPSDLLAHPINQR